MTDDVMWMQAALALGVRARGHTGPNPNVGCVIVHDGTMVGRGWTQPGGRPHAEAMALAQAGSQARGATAYVTLEPCAHHSARGPACAGLLAAAGLKRVVIGIPDPDPRTNGKGAVQLEKSGIEVDIGIAGAEAAQSMAPFLVRQRHGRPLVTLKLAASADGRLASPPGGERWITGPLARAHGHVERTRHDAILVGRGTLGADRPRLDVRLPGLAEQSPRRLLLTRGCAPEGWTAISDPRAIATLPFAAILVEGGAGAARAFLAADRVDQLLLYRAPHAIGSGVNMLAALGLDPPGNGWVHDDSRQLGRDRLDIFSRIRDEDACLPES